MASAVPKDGVLAQVEAGLTADLAGGGQKTFLVKLKAQADIEGVSAAAQAQAAAAGKTPHSQRLAKAQAVVGSLKDAADQGQAGLLTLLADLKQKGSVSSFEPFWIVNAIAVTGNANALNALAKRSEVATITESRTFQVLGGPAGAAGAPAGAGGATAGSGTSGGGSADSIEWNIQRIGAPAAWAMGIDGTGIVVANLDTGVDGNHPALARKWRGADGSNPAYSWFDAVNNRNTVPYDDHDHGTHTMGTIVGSDEAGTNQIGVAPGARWIAAKILNAAGSGTDVDILEAGQWIMAPGGDVTKAPDVVSNSWGGGPGIDEWFRPTVAAWRAAGILPVFANGNDGPGAGTVSEPGNYPESTAVGAVDANDNVAGFSSRGPSPYGEIKPEVSAPGVNIRSSVPGGSYQGGWSGTSMATPHVAGVAALLLQANASLTPDDLEAIMKETATPRTDSTYTTVPNNGYGYGIVNAFDAVSAVVTGRGTLTGRVATGGDDFESPVITFTAPGPRYCCVDVPLTAQVSDNVAVTEVNLYARMQGDPYYTVIPMQRTAGDYKSGTYRAAIPGYLVQEPAVQYYIRAVDYGNNPASTGTQTLTVLPPLRPGWSTDLETDLGLEHGGNADTWQWGVPTSGPNAAHSGSNVYATNLSGNYSNSANAYLLMPPIDLRGVSQAQLSFWQWYEFENSYDYGDVWVIDQNGTQTRLLHQTGSAMSWAKRTVDLTPWAGQAILVLFNQTSDSSVQKLGWYLDDISLLAPDAVAPAAPTGLTGTSDALGAVSLSWTANTEPDMGHYNLYRSLTSGSGYALVGSPVGTTAVDSGATTNVPNYYVVTAVDMWGNESAYSSEFSITPAGPVTVFFDNMEGGANGWTHGGTQDQWQLGTPTSGPGHAYSGSNLWATNLAGSYSSSANAWLMSPPVNLTGVTNATLQFAHWYEFETNYDKGYVEITTNGGSTWTQLGNAYTGSSGAFVLPTFDLTPYAGQTVNLRFRMTSDSSINKAGWYIDDVKILSAQSATSDGAQIFTKPPEKLDTTPVYKPSQPGIYQTDLPGNFSVAGTGIGIQSLPADATVTIVETGRSVRTDPASGTYTMAHAAGAYTARAEAYGYFPADAAVNIPADGTVSQNFLLQPIPTGTIHGMVTNARTGAPISGATVQVMEDSRVAPVTTGADGTYSLNVLQGTYTLRVTAPNYKAFRATVTVPGNGAAVQDAALEPFIGFPGQLVYDDGTAENAHAFYDAGNGWAVRMTPDPAKGSAMLTAAGFYTWDTTWPSPGGTAFSVAVYDATGADGAPGKMLAGPIPATANRGQWTSVDLSGFGLSFDQDFYVVYIQGAPYPNSPGLGTDESGTNYGRSWQMVGGGWSPSPADEGNYMIRAEVKYELGAPTITSPVNGSATNVAEMTVEGTSVNGATVNLYKDEVKVGSAAVSGGHFSIPVTLSDGANVLTATAQVPEGETRPSAPVTVILDQVAPTLTVTAPAEGFATNRDAITVTGTVADEHLAAVTVNGQAVTVANGSFSYKMLVNEGDNLITVVATDLAHNTTTVERHVTVDTAAPAITNVTPAADVTLTEGQSLTIAFDSEPGLTAGYRIVVAGSSGSPLSEPNMHETAPGHYEGNYTVPAGTAFTGATVEVSGIDAAGNRTDVAAAGKLTVQSATPNQPPVAKITLPKTPKAKTSLTFSGTGSTDPDGTIVGYHWTFSDGGTADGATVTHTFAAKGTYTVTLTVTDNRGATNTATATISVK
jgi:bacillopeptidase F